MVVAESMIRRYLIFSKDYSSGDGVSREHDQDIFNISKDYSILLVMVLAESMIRIYLIFSKDYSSGDGGSGEQDKHIFYFLK